MQKQADSFMSSELDKSVQKKRKKTGSKCPQWRRRDIKIIFNI